MKKLLLTGFEPFLEFPVNPTAVIVEELDGEEINDYHIAGEILSVDFSKSGNQIIELIEKHDPDAVISLGLAAGRNSVTPERIAINCNDGPVDNRGYRPEGERIFEDGQDGYFANLPLNEMIRNLRAENIPAKISNTAGAYLCNNVMYHALYYSRKNKPDLHAGFIHLPASHALAVEKNLPSWSDADLLRAVKIAISSM